MDLHPVYIRGEDPYESIYTSTLGALNINSYKTAWTDKDERNDIFNSSRG